MAMNLNPDEAKAMALLSRNGLVDFDISLRCVTGRCKFGKRIGNPGRFTADKAEQYLRGPRKAARKHAEAKGHAVSIRNYGQHIEYVVPLTGQLGQDEDTEMPF